jgi:hypothetical protein
MGTSKSKPDAPPSAPLVPPWANQDPMPPPSPPDPMPDPGNVTPEAEPAINQNDLAEPYRYKGFRTALGQFSRSGDKAHAKSALGHWSRTSAGGASNGSRRLGRAISSGGTAIAAFANALANRPPPEGAALDVRSLNGQPVEVAIEAIVNSFCPPGILDEELARVAIGEAFAVALGQLETFNPASISSDAVRIVTLAFVTELVFNAVAGDAGKSLANAPDVATAAKRERDLRSLVKEVVDVVGSPLLSSAGYLLTRETVAEVVNQIVRAAEMEMASW